MRKNKRWTFEDLELLEKMYSDPEVTLEEMASLFNTSKRNLTQIAKYYRIKRHRYEDEGYGKCCVCKHCNSKRSKERYYKDKKEV